MVSIANFLKDKGIQPSLQRIHIAKYLTEHRDHPSADDVYNRLSEQIPTLSKATVYNTLNLFYSYGVVNVITTSDGERHFDAFTEPHAHSICPCCGAIEDIFLAEDTIAFLKTLEKKNSAESCSLILRKTCNNCLKNKKK